MRDVKARANIIAAMEQPIMQAPWGTAQVRVPYAELVEWHRAARKADLKLAHALRVAMRAWVRAQNAAAAEPTTTP